MVFGVNIDPPRIVTALTDDAPRFQYGRHHRVIFANIFVQPVSACERNVGQVLEPDPEEPEVGLVSLVELAGLPPRSSCSHGERSRTG